MLVVDPAPEVRMRLVARLVEAGLEVVAEATSSIFARSYARTHAPDAIVLDVDLPDRGGLVLIGELKAIAPRAFVAVLTNAMAYRRHCLEVGADTFLDKSADFDALCEILRQVRAAPPLGT